MTSESSFDPQKGHPKWSPGWVLAKKLFFCISLSYEYKYWAVEYVYKYEYKYEYIASEYEYMYQVLQHWLLYDLHEKRLKHQSHNEFT